MVFVMSSVKPLGGTFVPPDSELHQILDELRVNYISNLHDEPKYFGEERKNYP